MANSLTIAALDNNSVSVPIGKTVLTNKKVQNSKSVQAAMTGADVQAPVYTLIDAPGYNGEQAYRTNADVIYFDTPIDRESLQIAEINFDDNTGTLKIIRKNGTEVAVTSFLRQTDFGVGPQGERGNPGTDGDDGKDGEDGEDGTTGCAGPNGAEGRTGVEGDDGIEGDVGATGPVGPLGPTGPRGDQGVQGPPGYEGKRGACGFTCPTTSVGPCGPQGVTMNKNVQTAAHATSLDLIWAAPDDCICPVNPVYASAEAVNKVVEFH